MKKTLVGMAALSIVAVMGASAPAEAKAASFVSHVNEGSDQAFAIMCETWQGPLWVQKNQNSGQKCPTGFASMMDVGNAYDILCKPSGGGWWQAWRILGTYQGMKAIPTGDTRECKTVAHNSPA